MTVDGKPLDLPMVGRSSLVRIRLWSAKMKTLRLLGMMLLSIGPTGAIATELPPICLENAEHSGHDMSMDAGGAATAGELMAGMDKMNADMMAGATATDIDVAFVCSMIPHHQGAIDMAQVELEQGDDPWVLEMAQQVIDAQEAEIAAMLAWLDQVATKR